MYPIDEKIKCYGKLVLDVIIIKNKASQTTQASYLSLNGTKNIGAQAS